jgi:hypothetical protein
MSRRIACCTLSIVVLILVLAQAAQAQQTGTPLPVDDYWSLLQETQTLVLGLETPPSEADLARLAAAAERWEQITAVTLPDHTAIPLDPSFLVAQLRADPPDLSRLGALLAAQTAAFQEWPQSIHQPTDVAALEKILARPEFQWPETRPSPLREMINRLLERLQAFFRRARALIF